MPLAPIAGSLIAGLGTTAGATIGAAAIGGAASLYAGSQQSRAARQGMDAQQQATDQAMRLQQEQFARQQQNITPFMEAGGLGLNALLAEFGLGGGQGGGANVGGTQYDVASYVQQNPDVQAMGQQLQQQGVIGQGGQWPSVEAWAADVQLPNALASGEDRVYPTMGADRSSGSPMGSMTGSQSFDAQIAALGGRPNMARPDFGDRPDYIAAPDADTFFGEFEESPGYQFLQDEARRGVNARQYTRGIGASGGTMKALQDRAMGLAAQDYGNWFNRRNTLYQTALGQNALANQFNQNAFDADRGFGTSAFESDRLYGNANFDADRNYLAGQRQQNISNLGSLVNMGANAASQIGSAGANFAANTGNIASQNANALAAGYGQMADARASGVNALAGGAQSVLSMFGANNRSTVTPLDSVSALSVTAMPRPTNIMGLQTPSQYMPRVSFG